MRLNRILALSAAVALAIAVLTPADAQFGGILKKAKKAAEEKVKSRVEGAKMKAEMKANAAVNKAVNEAADKAVESTGVLDAIDAVVGSPEASTDGFNGDESNTWEGPYNGLHSLYQKDLKPSAEAVAADPKASDTTVEQGYTKSPAQIRGVWEKLSSELFPYQPYYVPENLAYYNTDGRFPAVVYNKMCDMLENADRTLRLGGVLSELVEYKDGTNVPIVEFLLNPYFAEFFADPQGSVPYNHFVTASIVARAMPSKVKLNTKDDGYKYTVTMGDGSVVSLFEKEVPRTSRWHKVEGLGIEMATSVTPIEIIIEAINNAINQYKKYEADGNTKQMVITSREIQLMMKHLTLHDEYEQRKKDFVPLMRVYERIEGSYRSLLQSNYDASAPAVAMPKGVSVSAALQNTANAEGKKQWGDKFVKAIFTTSKWTEYKNKKFPYEINMRTLDVDFITKEGDNYFVNHWVLKENVSNGKGTGVYNINAQTKLNTREKVNYK